jgi:hypothetical protein
MTLSHCWGRYQPFTATDDNIEALYNSIDFEVLPTTFQDAISVARRLKIKYL